jgi:hypothetical protein
MFYMKVVRKTLLYSNLQKNCRNESIITSYALGKYRYFLYFAHVETLSVFVHFCSFSTRMRGN